MRPEEFYKQVSEYYGCVKLELEQKRRDAGLLSKQRGALMKRLEEVEAELNPMLDRITMLEREQRKLSVFA